MQTFKGCPSSQISLLHFAIYPTAVVIAYAFTLQISFGAILTPLGVFLLTYGFGSFFQLLPGSDIAAILLIYGFPITLLGFALSYAQLKPVPCKTTQEALKLRDAQATDIQKQVTSASSLHRIMYRGWIMWHLLER